MKKVAVDVSRAKAHEAYITYKADRKVARAVEHAMKHSGDHLEHALTKAAVPGIGGVGIAGAALAGLESAHISGKQLAATNPDASFHSGTACTFA